MKKSLHPGVFWIGWFVWFLVAPWLLLLLPDTFPLTTWTRQEDVLFVTWAFLVLWGILFWVWPFALRFSRSVRALVRIGQGIRNAPRRLVNSMRKNPLFFITWAVLLVGWQIVSIVAPEGTLEHPLVPGWDYVFGDTLFRMSGDWLLNKVPILHLEVRFEELAPYPALIGDHARTWPAVFLALAFHSFMTLSRLLVGLGIGLVVGIATGMAIPYWPVLRQTAWAPMNFLRMIPLLAAIPWLQFGLGANFRGAVAFIAFGVWVTLVVATMNSVANVPDRFIESARTLGASRPYTYFKVIVPGAMPELRTALLLSAGLGWSLTIAAEFLGFPTGLGHMASIAVQETNTARLVIVAFVVACYSLLTFYMLNQMFNRLVSWMPQRAAGTTDISKVAGAAGAARAERVQEV
ncbi:MAG: ABC transporter permease subunit [bacterium]|nr:ABC transporter permease subunit [Acidimicrobiia bacterium]MCY4649891.1 ABC transporter permease subunit [bacterium]